MLSIHVVPYDPTWPSHFARLADQLRTIISDVPILSIEHVGSTSVPGLAAKPVIDIDILVTPEWFPAAAHALGRSGRYTYNPEPRYMDRLSFRYDPHAPHDAGASTPTPDGDIRRQVYLVMPVSKQFEKHVLTRHVLRKHAALRNEYGRHKLELSRREHDSISAYGKAKSDILGRILQQAEEDPDALAEHTALCAGRSAAGPIGSAEATQQTFLQHDRRL